MGYNPKKGVAYSFQITMRDITGGFLDDATIAVGDATVSKDGGAFANLTTTPTVIAGTPVVNVSLSAAEMDADTVTVRLVDQTSPNAWLSVYVNMTTEGATEYPLYTSTIPGLHRPSVLLENGTLTWQIQVYDELNGLLDADSTPTVAVRKNGAATADVVTVTKRAGATGIYDCTYNPAGESNGDQFVFEETVTVSATPYFNAFGVTVINNSDDFALEATAQSILEDTAEAVLKLASSPVTLVSARSEAGLIQLVRGTDYTTTSFAGPVELPVSNAYDLSSSSFNLLLTFNDGSSVSITPTLADAGGANQRLQASIAASDFASAELGALHEFKWTITDGGGETWVPEDGRLDIQAGVAP